VGLCVATGWRVVAGWWLAAWVLGAGGVWGRVGVGFFFYFYWGFYRGVLWLFRLGCLGEKLVGGSGVSGFSWLSWAWLASQARK